MITVVMGVAEEAAEGVMMTMEVTEVAVEEEEEDPS